MVGVNYAIALVVKDCRFEYNVRWIADGKAEVVYTPVNRKVWRLGAVICYSFRSNFEPNSILRLKTSSYKYWLEEKLFKEDLLSFHTIVLPTSKQQHCECYDFCSC